jgi:WD40 repeat protein
LDGHVKIWRFDDGILLKDIDTGPGSLFRCNELSFEVETWGVSFSDDGKYVACSGQTGNVTIWNVESGTYFFCKCTDKARSKGTGFCDKWQIYNERCLRTVQLSSETNVWSRVQMDNMLHVEHLMEWLVCLM